MAMPASNNLYASMLQHNNKGWNSSLFADKAKITTFLCKSCNNVCRDAVELGCDHDDDEEEASSYCNDCLLQILNDNNNVCPINSSHKNTTFHSSRTVRKYILKLIVHCPNSAEHQKQVNDNNDKNVMDTNDEKEGINIIINRHNDNNKDICHWKGTLNELLTTHIPKCKAESKDMINKRIERNKNEINTFASNLKKMENKHEETSNILQSLRSQFVNLNNAISQRRNEDDVKNKKINEKLSQKDHEIAQLNATSSTKQQEIELLKQQLNAINKEIKSMKQIIDALVTDKSNNNDDVKQEYGVGSETFDQNYVGSGITLTDSDQTATKSTSYDHQSVFLKTIIGSTKKYHWKFKILSWVTGSWNPFIGIYKINTSDTYPIQTIFTNTKNNGYAYVSYNGKGNKTVPSKPGQILEDYGTIMRSGDIIDMFVDMKTLTLSFHHNGTDYGKAFDIERTQYKAAVSFCASGNSIKLLSFQQTE